MNYQPTSIVVNTQRNEINGIKAEPRIVKLLCLLMENRGQLITRTQITDDVWNGYGGGDEGLTQAISFLRKILQDDKRKIIETIPKKGYILNVTSEKLIEQESWISKSFLLKPVLKKFRYAFAAGVVLIILAGFMANQKMSKSPAAENSFPGHGPGKHDSIHTLKHGAFKSDFITNQ